MATLTIGGKKVKVDDRFLSLTPEQQQATVEEIAASLGAGQTSARPPAPQIQQPSPIPETEDNGMWGIPEQAMDTLTMGLQSKLNAAGVGLIDATLGAIQGDGWNYSDAYNRHLQEQRENQGAYQRNNPIKSAIGTGAGVALGVARLPMFGKGVKGAAATGSGYGATGGAAQDADTLKERGLNTLLGSGLGGLIGAGGYYGGGLLAKVAEKVGKVVSTINAPPEVKAASQIYEAAQREAKKTGVDLNQRLSLLGGDALNVDVLGRRGTALGRGAANISPEARETMESGLLARKSGQNARLVEDIEKAAGIPAGNRLSPDDMKKKFLDSLRPAINRAYDRARSAGSDMDLEPLAEILDSPMGSAAFDRAFKNVSNRMATSGDKAGGNLAVLDQMKRELDSMASAAFRAGENADGAIAADMAKALRTKMDDLLQGPEYLDARSLRAQAYEGEEAFDIGGELAKPRVPFETLAKAKKVKPEYAANVRQAYAAEKAESLLNRGSTEGAMNELNTPMGRESLLAALGPNSQGVIKALDREKLFNSAARELTGNSTTARQLAEMAGTGVGTASAGMLLGYDPTTSGIAGGIAALGRKAIPTIAARLVSENQRKVAPFLAEILMSRGLPTNKPIPPGFLERFVTGGDQKLAKTLNLIWASEIQKTNRQTAPAN